MERTKPVYLDNAATTQPYQQVIDCMADAMANCWGNPSSPHAVGNAASALLADSRATIADAIGAEPEEIVFTSGSTESNNLAIRGACLAAGRGSGQIITSALEHASVTKAVRGMRRDEGWACSYVDAVDGKLDLDQLRGLLADPTTLITMMRVQNEAGWIFPIDEVAALRDELAPEALLHCDATQAFGKIDVKPRELGCELLTAGAHKIGGPRGIGFLYVKQGTKLFTTAFGGNQEQGLRSGTEAVPLAAGMAEAVRISMANLERNQRHVSKLRQAAIEQLRDRIEGVVINGETGVSPYILSIRVPGLPNARSVSFLSEHGVCVSRASACTENHTTVAPGTWRKKHPLSLENAGLTKHETTETLRVSFNPANTLEDVGIFVETLAQCAEKHRTVRLVSDNRDRAIA